MLSQAPFLADFEGLDECEGHQLPRVEPMEQFKQKVESDSGLFMTAGLVGQIFET